MVAVRRGTVKYWESVSCNGEVDDVTCREWTDWFVHADPDRRGDRPRPTRHLEAYLPDLQWMQRLVETARGGAIKLVRQATGHNTLLPVLVKLN